MSTDLNAAQTTTQPKPAPARNAEIRWHRPALDVFESGDGLLLQLDVPGVATDALSVHLTHDTLVVEGVRSDGARGWCRSLVVPDWVDRAAVRAHPKNGVLEVALPRAAATRARRIEVR